ncbi:unnamed protein product [Cunninghamella echinulata]
MDLRVLDDIVIFMKEDNLTNRYDHFILAGASLGTHNDNPYGPKWKETLFQNFEIAKNIHHIEDVYIVEHRDCGAYKKFLSNNGTFGDSDADQQKEYKIHKHYSDVLSKEILKKYSTPSNPLKIKTFIMDLREPPKFYKRYTSENIKQLKKAQETNAYPEELLKAPQLNDFPIQLLEPPTPPEDAYVVFDQNWKVNDRLPTLEEQNIKQLFPSGEID